MISSWTFDSELIVENKTIDISAARSLSGIWRKEGISGLEINTVIDHIN